MPTHLKKVARYRAHAATSLGNAEAARDDATRRAHLAVARHFYLLAEAEIGQREAKRKVLTADQHPQVTPGCSIRVFEVRF